MIAIMFAGVGAGYLLRRLRFLQRISLLIMPAVCVLLFVMGLSVGSSDRIVRNLPTLGTQALILALAGTLGSLLAALAVEKFFFRKK
jgi:uncharacterized membrane protein YbjE (DUF340 family)